MSDDENGNGALQLPPDDGSIDEFGPPFQNLKDVRQARALRFFLTNTGGRIKDVCHAAGISYSTWYSWLNNDTEFRRLYDRALEAIAGDLEPDVMARAQESDVLAMFILKAWKPSRYREKQVVELVSPDVQSRLSLQADAILEACRETLDRDTAALVASTIAGKLREIWA